MNEAKREEPGQGLDDALLQSVFTDPGHADVNQQSTVTHLSRKIFRVVGGDIENAPVRLRASESDNTATEGW